MLVLNVVAEKSSGILNWSKPFQTELNSSVLDKIGIMPLICLLYDSGKNDN